MYVQCERPPWNRGDGLWHQLSDVYNSFEIPSQAPRPPLTSSIRWLIKMSKRQLPLKTLSLWNIYTGELFKHFIPVQLSQRDKLAKETNCFCTRLKLVILTWVFTEINSLFVEASSGYSRNCILSTAKFPPALVCTWSTERHDLSDPTHGFSLYMLQ